MAEVPVQILEQLSENGRLVTVIEIIMRPPAVCWHSAVRMAFQSNICLMLNTTLPEFKKTAAFQF